jgi:hypothetical protein
MAGQDGKAPALTLTAIGSGRQLDLAATGVRTLLICFGQETQAGTEAVEAVARGRFPTAAELLVGHVVDLHKIPSILRKVAEGVLSGEHKKAVAELEAGKAPEEYVVIFPDWDGSTVTALGLEDATKAIGLVVLSADGGVEWRYQGAEPADAVGEYLNRR